MTRTFVAFIALCAFGVLFLRLWDGEPVGPARLTQIIIAAALTSTVYNINRRLKSAR